ncbi:MAG: hypothetical protein V7735_25030 [Photobacterium frigidiphilum]|uniref:hypothetical protein n=1 Tax=Photobacterium frigidiphilum TaxID=264736 RepID=UPI0030031D22
MSTLIISILSGLIGASIAAYFNYRIRLSLLEKANRDSERKLAYVYVVQLSQYLAIKFLIENFLEKALEHLDEPLPEGEFELTHAASIYIEDALSNIDDDFFDKVDSIDKMIDQMMEGFNNTYLSNEQQANLPKQTILFYQRYEHYLKSTAVSFKFFKACLSNKKLFDMVNAKQINSSIETVKSLFDAAGLLRAAMAEYGGIGSKESTYILEQQYEFLRKNVANEFEHDKKLGKAKAHLEESGQLSANNSSKKDAQTARAYS